MCKNVLIHIGYPKTGTTWFQNQFFVLHPQIGFFNDREWIAKMFINLDPFEFRPDDVKARIEKEFEETSEKKLFLLSHEGLSGRANYGGYLKKDVADRLKETFPEAKILIFIRNQVEFIDSLYRQYVKMGGTCSLKNYLKDHLTHNLFSFAHLKFDRLINYYMESFGKDSVMVQLYEDFREDHQKVVDDICMFANIKRLEVGEMRKVIFNPSFSKFSVFISRNVNKVFVRSKFNPCPILPVPKALGGERLILKGIDRIFSGFVKRSYLLDEEVRKYVENYYRESNRQLERLLNRSLSEKGYAV